MPRISEVIAGTLESNGVEVVFGIPSVHNIGLYDALKDVARGVNELHEKGMGVLLITHYQRILQYIKPDHVHVFVNGDVVAEARIDKTVPFMFSADETMDIGVDSASPVTDDYGSGHENVFTGRIQWVQIDLEDDDVSHLEDPEQTYHRIIARQ